ncbi:unnamed protein product [Bursaphelenchus okinawaensis]|uniref:PUM-HD domain-containing protein n=1 Tax=Bursaphelenchus okinawaensis TaxID=465554 RepID=A0A811KUE3_9BILA|nr:unnamed protein product [Bursaphelenchus okinawaensis]CAG9111159.1 unnamed protein product [Bursaphelenchus okinawaensis]
MSIEVPRETQLYTLDIETDPFGHLDSRYRLAELVWETSDALVKVGYETVDEATSLQTRIKEIPLVVAERSLDSGFLTLDSLEVSCLSVDVVEFEEEASQFTSTPHKSKLPSAVQILLDSCDNNNCDKMFSNSVGYNRFMVSSHQHSFFQSQMFNDSRVIEESNRIIDEFPDMADEVMLLKFSQLEKDLLIGVLGSKHIYKNFRQLQERFERSEILRSGLVDMLVSHKVINTLSMDPMANYVIQDLIKRCPEKHEKIMKEFCRQPKDLANGRCSSRVLQEAVEQMEPNLVKDFLFSLQGHEVDIARDQCGNHVIQKIFDCHHYSVFDDLTRRLSQVCVLDSIVKSKYGCRVIQKCLETLADAITEDTVPDSINCLVMPLLQRANEYTRNEYANYVIQNLMKHPALERQRDYIIDVVVVGNILTLSQDKFASHVVETALEVSNTEYMNKLCTEIFDDYEVNAKHQTALEIMMLDQYGNYVAQKLLDFVIHVHDGQVPGDQKWIQTYVETVIRLRSRLENYSSGKKILERICLLTEQH